MKNRSGFLGAALLAGIAFIWGLGIVVMRFAAGEAGPYTALASRSVLACTALFAYCAATKRIEFGKKAFSRELLRFAIPCGIVWMIGSMLQTVALTLTTAGKTGFITVLYIVIVPVLGIFLKKKTPARIWLCVAIALAGLYLLSISGGGGVNVGDFLALLGSVCFAVQIILIDEAPAKEDPVKFTFAMYIAALPIAIVAMFAVEGFNPTGISDMLLPYLYLGVISTAFTGVLQVTGQRLTNPVAASLLMSLESVFAALLGCLFLNEAFTNRELAGCVIIFVAIAFAQLPDKNRNAA